MRNLLIGCLVVFAALGQARDTVSIAGTVTYREKMAMPANAMVHVTLEDTSFADSAAIILAEATIDAKGKQVPIPFSLKFERSRIQPDHQYSVRGSIRSEGKLVFASSGGVPVKLDGTDGPAEVVVFRVQDGPITAPVTTPRWKLTELRGAAPIPAGDRGLTLEFFPGDKRFAAFGGVNQMSGPYEVDGAKLKFGMIMSTLMAGPDNLMRQEESYRKALVATTKAKVFGNTLVLYAKDTVVLKFAPAPKTSK